MTKSILEHVPRLRKEWSLDFVIVNGENAAHGFGITEKICHSFYDTGVDVITTGNHVWDRKEVLNYIKEDPRLLRPLNYPDGSPGNGAGLFDAPDGRKIKPTSAEHDQRLDSIVTEKGVIEFG